MRWHPKRPERTFLRFLRALSLLMEIPVRDISLPMAWHRWRYHRDSASDYFRFLARGRA